MTQWRQQRVESDRAFDRMLSALPSDSSLRWKLIKCGEYGHWANNEWRCHAPACQRCRPRYVRRQQRQALEGLAGATNEQCSMVTVVLGIADDVEDIASIWDKGRSDLRNRINAQRRQDRRWRNAMLTGWVEADPIIYDDVAMLGSQQRSVLAYLNQPRWRLDGGPCWVVHLHGLIYHPEIDWQAWQRELSDQWPGEGRVDVEPFFKNRALFQNVNSIVRYATKFKAGRVVEGAYDAWPSPFVAEYYDWVDEYSRGWQSLRIRIGPSWPKGNPTREINSSRLIHHDELALSCNDEFNSFPILYTDSGYISDIWNH